MAATISNTTKNSASLTNQELTTASRTFGEEDSTFGEMVGPFGNPYNFANQTKSSASISNQSAS